MRKRRNKYREYIKIGCEIKDCKQCKEDSVAHKIKSFFDTNNIESKLLFKWDKETKKVLISKKALMHLLTICNSFELTQDYDMEVVDRNEL